MWNCYEVRHKNFISQVNIVLRGMKLKILVLIETKMYSRRGGIILNSLGYDSHNISEGDGFS